MFWILHQICVGLDTDSFYCMIMWYVICLCAVCILQSSLHALLTVTIMKLFFMILCFDVRWILIVVLKIVFAESRCPIRLVRNGIQYLKLHVYVFCLYVGTSWWLTWITKNLKNWSYNWLKNILKRKKVQIYKTSNFPFILVQINNINIVNY